LIDFLSRSTFDRIVARYNGTRVAQTLPCAAQVEVMAFAQITYWESLRDIEASLSAQSAKLYHMCCRGRFAAQCCPTPTKPAIGGFMPSLPSG
jgi:hypothetical protein